MNYTRYWNEGTAILSESVAAVEIGCDGCGAHWLQEGLSLTSVLNSCPYCEADDLNFGSDTIEYTTESFSSDSAGVRRKWGIVGLLIEQAGGASAYGLSIRAVVRALWGGLVDYYQAFDDFQVAVRLGLTRAWYEGAALCGIDPIDLSPAERQAITSVIFTEFNSIDGFLFAIEQGSKANGGKIAPLLSRADMWALRYPDVMARAQLMACSDQKLEWGINVVRNIKENCSSCLKLNGKVKRASYWARVGVQPQNPPNDRLVCQGWNCGCGLLPTDAPLSRGPLPNLP